MNEAQAMESYERAFDAWLRARSQALDAFREHEEPLTEIRIGRLREREDALDQARQAYLDEAEGLI